MIQNKSCFDQLIFFNPLNLNSYTSHYLLCTEMFYFQRNKNKLRIYFISVYLCKMLFESDIQVFSEIEE
jgi:hypothetical protein